MKTIIKILISLAASVVIFCVCILFGLLLLVGDDRFYESSFKKYEVASSTGLTEEGLKSVNDRTLDFLNSKADDLIIYEERYGKNTLIFNENEQSHMEDVKALYIGFKAVGFICVLAAAVYYYFMIKNRSKQMAKYVLIGCAGAAAIPAIFVAFFDKAFVFFHRIFFEGDSWLFSPKTNIIVNIYTEGFFVDFCTRLAVYAVSACLIFLLSALYFKNFFSEKVKRG
ncbi:MAG: TIGR01906 family membrane protein [Eubacteriaceae bacterium]|nr:TIGR01906 family membrane protein [Eubacteriaceae bacterium]